MGRRFGVGLVAGFAIACAGSPAHAAFDPVYEAKNFSKTTERFRLITGTPAYQLLLRTKNNERELQALGVLISDRERFFGGNLCWQRGDGCAGDVRLYDFVTRGAGIALPVLFTARNGSTLSGHVWATAAGPAKRPGVVITNGSVQAPEELYWFAAQTLAKAGYVVLTFDPQGQGYSDTFGEGADRQDGFPSQEGRPFYDNTEDALDFFFSTAASPYAPRPSCTSGTDHSAKQRSRVGRGLASGFNPLSAILDTGRVGIAGHSLGASAVSYVGQLDARVKAIVGLDNLRTATGGPQCASGSSPRPATVALTKPSLGISNDYGLLPQPNTSEPDPDAKTSASRALSEVGVDSGEVVIRGGTHYEPSFIPNPAFGGTYRGNDLVAWYVLAWMDKYVKGDPSADARLLTSRWRADSRSGAIDVSGDANMLSTYYRSRFDVGLAGGGRYVCEDLRTLAGCGALAHDGGPEPYDAIAVAQSREASAAGPGADAAAPWRQTTDMPGSSGAPPAASGGPQPPTLEIKVGGLVTLRLRLG
jgi:hypothetical protein